MTPYVISSVKLDNVDRFSSTRKALHTDAGFVQPFLCELDHIHHKPRNHAANTPPIKLDTPQHAVYFTNTLPTAAAPSLPLAPPASHPLRTATDSDSKDSGDGIADTASEGTDTDGEGRTPTPPPHHHTTTPPPRHAHTHARGHAHERAGTRTGERTRAGAGTHARTHARRTHAAHTRARDYTTKPEQQVKPKKCDLPQGIPPPLYAPHRKRDRFWVCVRVSTSFSTGATRLARLTWLTLRAREVVWCQSAS